jgi:nitroreductase
MDIFQVITDRRSIRKYKDIPVEREKIEQVLNAARLAPSWKNLQCWRFLVLTDPAKRAALVDAFPDDNPGRNAIAMAPCVIVACADPTQSGDDNGIQYYAADTAIAFEHICLSAHALGLGTCWMGWYDESKIKAAVGVPDEMRVICMTPIGYPDQEPKARPRKALSEIAYYENWGETGC